MIIEFHLKLRKILSLAFDSVLAIIGTRSEPFNTAPAINIQRRKIISVLFDLVLALRNSCKSEVVKRKTTCTSSFDEIGVVLVSKYNYKIICQVFGTSAVNILKLWLTKYRGRCGCQLKTTLAARYQDYTQCFCWKQLQISSPSATCSTIFWFGEIRCEMILTGRLILQVY